MKLFVKAMWILKDFFLQRKFNNEYIKIIPFCYISACYKKGFCNKAMYGCVKVIIKNPDDLLLQIESHIEFREALIKTVKEKKLNEILVRFKQNKDSIFICSMWPNFSIFGKIKGISMIWRDISNVYINIEKLEQKIKRLTLEIEDYKNAFNQLPYLLWIRDKNMKIVYFNNEYFKFIEERSVSNCSDIAELNNECIVPACESVLHKKHVNWSISVTAGNTLNILSLSEVPLFSIGGTIGIGHDITQKKQLEKESLRTSDVYRNFFGSLSNGIAIYNSSKQIVFYNNAFVSIFNLDTPWLDTKPYYTEILEKMRDNRKIPEQADFKKFKENQINLFSNLIDVHNEFHYLPDGTALRIAIIPGVKGELLFSYEDITDKLTLEQLYNTAVAVSKTTINNLHEAIAVYAEDGRLKLFNPALQNMFCIDENYLRTMPHVSDILDITKDIYNNDDWENFKNEEILAITNKIMGEKSFKLINGKHISRDINVLPDGAILVTYYEITAIKLLEQSLRNKNDMLIELASLKSNFFSSVSYELRSPLTSIIGFAEMLIMFYKDSLTPSNMQYIVNIYESAKELSNITNNILDFSSIESGIVELNRKKISIICLIDILKNDIYSNTKINNNISIVCDCCEEIWVNVDEKLLARGMTHLVAYVSQVIGKALLIRFDVKSDSRFDKYLELIIDMINDKVELEDKDNAFIMNNGDATTNVNFTIAKQFIEWNGGAIVLCFSAANRMEFSCTIPIFQYNQNVSI